MIKTTFMQEARIAYEAPQIYILDVSVEQGFAVSKEPSYGNDGESGSDPGVIGGGDY